MLADNIDNNIDNSLVEIREPAAQSCLRANSARHVYLKLYADFIRL
jgi:hypothetical protein